MKYLIILTLLSCSRAKHSPAVIDPAFAPYIKTFNDYGGPKVNVNVIFADLAPYNTAAVGMCFLNEINESSSVIKIDINYWPTLGQYGKEETILHELGHCVLGLYHDTTLIYLPPFVNVPKSIMYPSIFGDYLYYVYNRDYYIKEMIK